MAAQGINSMSGRNFDAFVSSQRTFNEVDWATKIQEKYWRARQKFLAKIEKKEDICIVLSDSKLDAKLELYHSIDNSCAKLINILENYQNYLFAYANEENALGILLKECGKHDKTKAGKIMAITGRSLTQSSHHRIRLYAPIMRLYQEMETFHSRAVDDTADTVDKLESKRSQYRASLLWMKNISEKLDPDIYRQLDKFRRVQSQVRTDKEAFDSLQMDVVQKIDLLMASRCNLMNQILAPYQTILLETFDKCCNNFKSVEDMISKEDIYDYEFKTLKQLNSLKLSDSSNDVTAHLGENEEKTVEDLLFECDDAAADDNSKCNVNNHTTDNNIIDISESTSLNDDNRKEPCDPKQSSSNKPKIQQQQIIDLLNSGDEENEDLFDLDTNLTRKQDDIVNKRANSSKNNNDVNDNSQAESNLMDLFTNELEEIENSSYFKSLQKLQI